MGQRFAAVKGDVCLVRSVTRDRNRPMITVTMVLSVFRAVVHPMFARPSSNVLSHAQSIATVTMSRAAPLDTVPVVQVFA